MSTRKLLILTGASALVLAGAAQASAAVTQVYGGGSSLIAPYARQAFDCYGNATALITSGPPPSTTSYSGFDYTGSPAVQCQGTIVPPTGTAVDATVTFNYDSTGSGAGIQALADHNPLDYGAIDGSGDHYPTVNFAFAETAINANDVLVWNTGANGATNADGTTNTEGANEIAGKKVNVMAPGDAPGANQFASPLGTYGHLIQIPVLVAPVDMAFSQTYRKIRNADNSVTNYNLQFHYTANLNGVLTPVLRLSQDAYCKIFNGQITNWNDPELKTLNGNKTLQDPAEVAAHVAFNVPLQIVGRADSSGTTNVWTRHLAVACAGVTYTPPHSNQYADSTSTLPAATRSGAAYTTGTANQPAAAGEALGLYTVATQSLGVAEYVSFNRAEDVPAATPGSTITDGRIGYVGNDFAMPYNATYGLAAAVLLNPEGIGSTTTFVAPSPKTAITSFGAIAPPQSDTKGNYVAGTTSNGLRTDPSAWVQPSSKTSILSFPQIKGGYPIVGTSNADLYTCYNDQAGAGSTANIGWKVNQFFAWYFKQKLISSTTAGALGLLPTNGLSAMPTAWSTAIYDTFVKPVTTGAGATNGLDLWISTQSDITSKKFTHNPDCNGLAGG